MAKRNALEVLFPGVKIRGYEIKPWTYRQAKQVMVPMATVVGALRRWYAQNGGGPEDLDPKQLDKALLKFPPEKILGELIPSIMDEAEMIVSVTLGKPVEEVGEMDAVDVSAVFLGAMAENMDYVKNFFGPKSPRGK